MLEPKLATTMSSKADQAVDDTDKALYSDETGYAYNIDKIREAQYPVSKGKLCACYARVGC